MWLLQVGGEPGECPDLGSHALQLALRGFVGRKDASGELKRGDVKDLLWETLQPERAFHSHGRDQTENWGYCYNQSFNT